MSAAVEEQQQPQQPAQEKSQQKQLAKQTKQKPNQQQLTSSIAAAKKVVEYQNAAANLKERAKKSVDPRERIQLWREAYDKEVAAHGESKAAKRLQSGVWQGGAAGMGIGAGTGLGIGAAVGTLVGGIVALPTTGLGTLIGAGVGGLHGPWIKLGGGGGEKKVVDDKPPTDAEVHAYAMQEAQTLDDAVETSASTVPQPPRMEDIEGNSTEPGEAEDSRLTTPRRKPRKLQVRSGNEVVTPPARKKPRKLEVRSGIERKENE